MDQTIKAVPLFNCACMPMPTPCELGETPTWDDRVERLTWIDIRRGTLYAYSPRNNVLRTFYVAPNLGFAVPTVMQNTLICGNDKGIFTFNLCNGEKRFLVHPEKHLPRNRFNDGKVDAAGRLLTGTIQKKETGREVGSARLYTISSPVHAASVKVVEAAGRVTISNGIGWSPDNKVMYHIDTPTGEVAAYSYNVATGEVANDKKVVYTTTEGKPDGMCVDVEGQLWVALVFGGKVVRVDPATGKVTKTVLLPCKLVTSCCFGGPYLSQLYITTALGLSEEEIKNNKIPHAGQVFVADVGVCGMPMTPFKLRSAML